MSVTNFIDDDRMTILQGVNGICLCEETWMVRRKADKLQSSKLDNLEEENF